jgi:hypothetical protein
VFEGKESKLTFQHIREHNEIAALCTEMAEDGPATQPTVVTWVDLRPAEGDYAPFASGHAFTHPNDNFCRETGRKIALTRLLRDYPKPVRAQVWKQYRERPRHMKGTRPIPTPLP